MKHQTGAAHDTQAIMDSLRRMVRSLRNSSKAATHPKARSRVRSSGEATSIPNARRESGGLSGRVSGGVSLTSAQFFILQKVQTRDGLTVNDLASLTYTHQSTVSETVQRLVAKKLIQKIKSGVDARCVLIQITKQGERALLGAERSAQERLLESIGALTPAKRRQFLRTLLDLNERSGFSNEVPELFFEDERVRPPKSRKTKDLRLSKSSQRRKRDEFRS